MANAVIGRTEKAEAMDLLAVQDDQRPEEKGPPFMQGIAVRDRWEIQAYMGRI